MRECGIMLLHQTTNPHFPKANGQAECGGRIAKSILKQPDPFFAMMTYRSTPTGPTDTRQLIVSK